MFIKNTNETYNNVSKIVDENGEPMVVYHRTPNEFTTFDPTMIGTSTDVGAFGRGFYLSPADFGPLYGKNLTPLFVNLKNPLMLNYANAFEVKEPFFGEDYLWKKEQSENFTDWFKKSGHDGIWYKDNGSDEIVAIEPNQIKSATENNGEFSTENDDIRFRNVQSNIGDEYMAAVENGDMETAQRLEKEVAARAKQVDAEITEAVNAAAQGLNTGVEIVSEIADVPDARRRGSKGWYENGRVYLVLPNAEGVEDAVETVLHEVVGHKGLRRLFGEKFDEMLSEVFGSVPRNVRAEILRRALDLIMRRGRKNFRHEATEEYLTPKIFPLSRLYNGRFRQRKQTTERKVIKGSITPSERSFRIAKSCLPSTDRQDFISLNQNIQVSK